MLRKPILCLVAGAAMIPAGAALAQRGGGHAGGGPGAGVRAVGGMNANVGGGPGHGVGAGANVNVNRGMSGVRATTRASVGTNARVNSHGALRASTRAMARANANSVLRGTRVISGPLAGLTVGAAVHNSSGVQIGTVRKILTASGGRVVNVLVRSSTSARTIPISPTSLSFSGGVATAAHVRGRI